MWPMCMRAVDEARTPNENARPRRRPGRSDGKATIAPTPAASAISPGERVLAEAEARPAVNERVVERVHEGQQRSRR